MGHTINLNQRLNAANAKLGESLSRSRGCYTSVHYLPIA
jgi:hypothetical protein